MSVIRNGPAKRKVLLAYLERGVAMLHLDARRPGVIVPKQFAQDPHLRLNLSYRFQIPDLEVGEAHVQATLSFGGRPFQCLVPWEAIFGITAQVTGDGQVWPEDLPAEVVEASSRPEEPRQPALSAVETEGDDAEQPSPKPKGPPHLRLVR